MEAIHRFLSSDVDLTNFLGSDVDIRTGREKIKIFQAHGDTIQETPSVAFDIYSTKPLVASNPANGHFKSLVTIYSIGCDQVQSSMLTDLVRNMFTRPPLEYLYTQWCPDLTTECVKTTYVKYMGDKKLGQKSLRMFDPDSDNYRTALDIYIQWVDCGCEGPCQTEVEEKCPLEDTDDNCDCD